MKAKKPARIKGRVMHYFQPPLMSVGSYIAIPIDNPDALVEQVARAIGDAEWSSWNGKASRQELATAALRSIGVPMKRAATKTAAPPS